MGSTSKNICLVFLPCRLSTCLVIKANVQILRSMCYKTFVNVVIVSYSHSKHVLFKYFVHFVKWFPAYVKGYGAGGGGDGAIVS